jgi:hypothetical protein
MISLLSECRFRADYDTQELLEFPELMIMLVLIEIGNDMLDQSLLILLDKTTFTNVLP